MNETSADHNQTDSAPGSSPMLGHLLRTVRKYLPVIAISLGTIAFAYALIATIVYVSTPSSRITSLPFRLTFPTASAGTYPNGTPFSNTEIVSPPQLESVFRQDNLRRFMTPAQFGSSIFILQTNNNLAALTAEYSERVADPRLTQIERDQIAKEFEVSKASLNANDLSINFLQQRGADLPEDLAAKVLSDILIAWTTRAEKERKVTQYQVFVVRPAVMDDIPSPRVDVVISIQVLRSRILHSIANINDLLNLPGATLTRTPTDQLSLADLRARLMDTLRFRLDPLISQALAAGLPKNRDETRRFVESQLTFDQRSMKYTQDSADVIRNSLVMYSDTQRNGSTALPAAATPSNKPGAGDAAVSETVIDRLLTLTALSADRDYRQRLVDRYLETSMGLPGAEALVENDLDVLKLLQSPSGTSDPASAEKVLGEFESIRSEARAAVVDLHLIHENLSTNLDPSRGLYRLTGAPATRLGRTFPKRKTVLYGVLLLLFSIPVVVGLCLLHNRLREEDALGA